MNDSAPSLAKNIRLSLLILLGLSFITLTVSYWIAAQVQRSPEAINVAGSLRYQTYQASFFSHMGQTETLELAIQALDNTWQEAPILALQQPQHSGHEHYQQAYQLWLDLRQQLLNKPQGQQQETDYLLAQQTETLVVALNQLIEHLQHQAEQSVIVLRGIFILALFLAILIVLAIFYWLRVRFEIPMRNLQQAAVQVGKGDFQSRVTISPHQDELATLGQTMNTMISTIFNMYYHLEQKADAQTEELELSHTALQLLYDVSTHINEKELTYDDYQRITLRLRDVLKIGELELCLVTEMGESPYMQVHTNEDKYGLCLSNNCATCIRSEDRVQNEDGMRSHFFPLKRDEKSFGVLVARCDTNELLHPWQQRLIRLVADQLALALNLKQEEDQVRRLAMLNERTVIARELHDSLAQALSYLKIQVVRLNKAIESENKELVEDVSSELKQGLDTAYRQLRELLTTFRLQIDDDGLLQALQDALKQLQQQTDMHIQLDYRITDIPLEPQEEIHLLQIIREATQNAINHSGGTRVRVALSQQGKQSIQLQVLDNGHGLPPNPERINHYGLAIITERASRIGGEACITNREDEQGTLVQVVFTPRSLKYHAHDAIQFQPVR